MPPKPKQQTQSRIESKTWWLIGLSILMILLFSVTIPFLLVSLVRAGALQGVLPADGGFTLEVGLVGLAAVFSLNLIYQQTSIDKERRRMVQDQMEVEQAKSRLAELASLFHLSNSLRMDLPLQTILEISVRRLASTLRAQEVDLYLLSREAKSLRCAASHGVSAGGAAPDIPYGHGPIGACAHNRQAILLAPGGPKSPFGDFLAAHPGIGSMLAVPLHVEMGCVGVLVVVRTSSVEPFRVEQRDVAQLFADNLGPVIDRAQAAVAIRKATAAIASKAAPETVSVAGSFQDSFLSAAAAELKSPLASIVAYTEVLDQNDLRLTPAMRAEFNGRCRIEAQGLQGVVDDILDLVRLELGRYMLDLHIAGVNDIVREATEAARPAAAVNQVTIELTLDPSIPSKHLDAPKLRQSIAHLVRSAVRFSPPKGCVVVTTAMEDGEVRITIQDKGPAFDAEEASEIYEIETDGGRDRKRARHRHGFGLHLAKRFVELHGGSVGAEAAADGGGVLWIRLPWSGDVSPLVGADPFAEELARM